MRLITAITLFSATVMATNHGQWGYDQQQNGHGQYGKQYGNEGWGYPKETPKPVEHTAPSYQQTYAPPAHEPSPPPAHEPSPPPPAHQMPSPSHEMPSPSHEMPSPSHEMPSPSHEMPPPAHTTEAPKPEHSMVVEPPPAGEKKVHIVTVGGDQGLVYTPQVVYAKAGETVHFIFMKQNHSVTQSTFAKPCNKLEGGEDSGLLPNPNNTVVPAPTWEYVVKDKEPTWWYCKQRTGTHCGKGMVFAINPTKEKTFDKFREVAIQINGTAAVTSAAPSATAPPPEQPKSTVTLINEPTDTPAPKPEEPKEPPKDVGKPPYTSPGWNEGGNGACNCACFCGVGSFPAGDGWGAYGGFGGSMAAPW